MLIIINYTKYDLLFLSLFRFPYQDSIGFHYSLDKTWHGLSTNESIEGATRSDRQEV